MKPPSISLCMIVRDEERDLPRCLESVRGAVDEIVVVDTGSKDGTVEVAKAAGARVFHHPWNDHFGEARNRSLEEARGDWILVLDADESLAPGSSEALREASKISIAGGFLLHLQNVGEGTKKSDNMLLVRFFRNHPSIRYYGRIHEQITERLNRFVTEKNLRIAPCEATILHTGYQSSDWARKGKAERNERLFRLHLEESPEDAYGWYKYAGFLSPISPARAKDALRRSHELLLSMPPEQARKQIWGAEVAARMAFNKLHEGDAREALTILEKAVGRHTPTPNFVFAIGCIALKNAEHALALGSFRACLGFEGQTFHVGVEPGITGPIAHYGMGEALRGLGQKKDAANEYRRALELLPGYPQAQQALDELLRTGSQR